MIRIGAKAVFVIAAVLAVQRSTATAADTPSFVVVRGALGTVYEAYPAKDAGKKSDGCGAELERKDDDRYGPQPFEDGLTFPGSPADPACSAVGITVSSKGLIVRFLRFGDANAAVSADDLPFAPKADGVVTITVGSRACFGGTGVLEYTLNAKQKSHVEACGHPAPWAAASVDALSPRANSKQKWLGATVTVPWDVLGLPYGTANVDVDVKCCSRSAPVFERPARVTIETTRAFDGLAPARALRYADDDQRSATLTQYYRYMTPDGTPPNGACPCIVVGGVSVPRFALTAPGTPAPLPTRVGAPNGEINAALTQGFVLSGTLAQSVSVARSTEKAIKDVITGALPSPKPSLPNFPCDACGTFQSLNASFFALPGATSRLSALPDSFGADDATFKLTSIGDLDYGGLLKTGGQSTQYGVATMRVADPSRDAYTDSAFGLVQKRGASSFNVVVTSVNKVPGPPPMPGATPGVVKRSHAVNYAVAMGDEHKTSTGDASDGTVTAVASFGRIAWDATDKALNGATGIQVRRAFTHGDVASTALASVGYRATDVGYEQLDGSPVSVPGVSGPFGALQFNRTPAGWTNPVYDVVLSAYTYRSSSDRATFFDGKIASAPLPKLPVSVYFEAQDTRQTPAVAAPSLIAKQLGTDPYRSAVNLLLPANRFIVLPGRDRTIGLQYAPKKSGDTQINVAVGWDFEHVVPSCLFGPLTTPLIGAPTPPSVVTCLPAVQATKQLTANGYVAVGNDFTLAGSFKPTFFQGARPASGQNDARPPTKVYSALASIRLNECDSVILSTSNDIEAVTPVTFGNVSKSFQAELNMKRYLGLVSDSDAGAPTLVLGVSNTFGFAQAGYNIVPPAGQPATGLPIVQIPYETHAFTVYAGLRFANRSFRAATAPDPRCAPRKKLR